MNEPWHPLEPVLPPPPPTAAQQATAQAEAGRPAQMVDVPPDNPWCSQ